MPAPHTRKDRSCVRRVRSSGVSKGSGSIPGKSAKTAHQNRREGGLNPRGKLVHVRAAVTPAADLPTSRLNGASATQWRGDKRYGEAEPEICGSHGLPHDAANTLTIAGVPARTEILGIGIHAGPAGEWGDAGRQCRARDPLIVRLKQSCQCLADSPAAFRGALQDVRATPPLRIERCG